MRFRPCIDIHNGKVKQIVGASLKDSDGESVAKENYVSEDGAAYFAELYRENNLEGGHIILLNRPGTKEYEEDLCQAREALEVYPGGMQLGGGVNLDNAEKMLDLGASHVIVTSAVFKDGKINYDNLKNAAITVEELYNVARENTLRLFPPFLMRLDQFLESRYPQEQSYPEEPEVYILSNQQFIYGATMMIYKDVVAEFAEQMGKNVYIVPSSVNEVLLCLTNEKREKTLLENTLREVNEFVVSDTDFLSDEVYFYDKELGNIVA